MAGWLMCVYAHFPTPVIQISNSSQHWQPPARLPKVTLDVRPLKFEEAIQRCAATLANPQAAKLLFIDQFGVDHVTPEVFRQLVISPTCDFLFFLSSSTLHRFRDHPAIKQKITRPDDHYQVHQAALDYYRGFLPNAGLFSRAFFDQERNEHLRNHLWFGASVGHGQVPASGVEER
jgi:hypothetical protein